MKNKPKKETENPELNKVLKDIEKPCIPYKEWLSKHLDWIDSKIWASQINLKVIRADLLVINDLPSIQALRLKEADNTAAIKSLQKRRMIVLRELME